MVKISIDIDVVTICSKLLPLLLVGFIVATTYQDGNIADLFELLKELLSIIQLNNL